MPNSIGMFMITVYDMFLSLPLDNQIFIFFGFIIIAGICIFLLLNKILDKICEKLVNNLDL